MIKRSTLNTILANYAPEALGGLVLGGAGGALSSRKHRLRNMLIGMLGGAAAGVGARHLMAGKDIARANKLSNNGLIPLDVRVPYAKGSWKKLPGVEAGIDALDKGIDKIKKASAPDMSTKNHHYMGFICKCAELGVDGDIVDKMYKNAWSRDYSDQQLEAARDNYAAQHGLWVDDAGLPGTWAGRTIRRIRSIGKPGRYNQWQKAIVRDSLVDARNKQRREYEENQQGLADIAGIEAMAPNPSYMEDPTSKEYSELRVPPRGYTPPAAPERPVYTPPAASTNAPSATAPAAAAPAAQAPKQRQTAFSM